MDGNKAHHISSKLIGKAFGEYFILEYVNNGKSAAVFKGKDKVGNFVAIKIFDDEIVRRYGSEVQLKRINQEISLKNHKVNGLIKIFDGGQIFIDTIEHYFLVMEYIEGKNLKDFIETVEYDLNFVKAVVATLVRVTEELLLTRNVAHRDIKPENIMVSSERTIILMDLGVLKIVGAQSFSDNEDERQFLGTLRYAPPEFLTRQEEDSSNGWRSINLYQIGTVLYELLEKKQLFYGETPYPNLVLAIKEKNPIISNRNAPAEINQLARNLLMKDWRKRLEVNPINRILEMCSKKSNIDDVSDEEINKQLEEISTLSLNHTSELNEIYSIRSSYEQKLHQKNRVVEHIIDMLNSNFQYLIQKELMISCRHCDPFIIYINSNELRQPKYVIYELNGGLDKGFSRPIHIAWRIQNDENAICEIGFFAAVIDKKVKIKLEDPNSFFYQLSAELGLKGAFESIEYIQVFKGVIHSEDRNTRSVFLLAIVRLVKKALNLLTDEVRKEIQTQREMSIRGLNKIAVIIPKGQKGTFLINSLD